MALSPEIQDCIKTYLWDVASHLHDASPASRREILRDVDSHIHEALLARGADPTMDDMQAILAEMPSPDSYAAEVSERQSGPPAGASGSFGAWLSRLTWQSVAGPLLLMAAFPLFIKGAIAIGFSMADRWAVDSTQAPWLFDRSAEEFRAIGSILVFLGVAALFASREVGRNGIDRIRDSDWQLYGFTGSYIAYIVPELVIIAFFVLFFGCIALSVVSGGDLTGFPILLVVPVYLVLLGMIYYFVIKYRWIRLKRRDDSVADA